MQFAIEHHFDPVQKRHYLNNTLSVIHCHHYASLMVQLADDAKEWKAPEHMRSAFAEATYDMLLTAYQTQKVEAISDKILIAQDLFRYLGMGKITLDYTAKTAEISISHVDEGWLSKWGPSEYPINFLGQGFIIAAFAAMSQTKITNWTVVETQSIVCGAKTSQFTATLL